MPSQQVAPGRSVGLRSVLSAPSRDAELQRAGGEGDAASATGALIKIYIKKKKRKSKAEFIKEFAPYVLGRMLPSSPRRGVL